MNIRDWIYFVVSMMTTVWLKYIGDSKIKISGIKKIDGTTPNPGESLDILKGDIFQYLESDAYFLLKKNKGLFVCVEKEDLRKEENLEKLRTFKTKLDLHREIHCNRNFRYTTKTLCGSLSKLYGGLNLIIDKFGNRNPILQVDGEETSLDIYEVSVGECKDATLFGVAIKECIQDVDMIISRLNTMSGTEFDKIMTERGDSNFFNAIYAQGDVFVNSKKKEYNNVGGVQNNNDSGNQDIKEQETQFVGKTKIGEDDVLIYVFFIIMLFGLIFSIKYIFF